MTINDKNVDEIGPFLVRSNPNIEGYMGFYFWQGVPGHYRVFVLEYRGLSGLGYIEVPTEEPLLTVEQAEAALRRGFMEM
jgi:hypothetical protein